MIAPISVLLPVFNGQKFLQDCIESVLRQTCGNFKLLIGDDCSSDRTSAIARSFHDSRIEYSGREKNLGLFKNLNMLIGAAQSPLIHILCQDDMLEPDCLKKELSFFSKYPGAGISFCKAYRIDSAGKVTGRCALGDLPEIVNRELAAQCFFYHGCMPGNLSTVCIRKGSFEKFGIFNENYRVAADYELWARMCRGTSLGVIHDHLVRLRMHSGQLSRQAASGVKFIDENRQVRTALLPLLPNDIRPDAVRYNKLRQNVLDTNYAILSLLKGRRRHFHDTLNIMGKKEFFLGVLWWALTVNNRLYRPKARFK